MEQESMNRQPLHQILQNSDLNLLESALPYVPGNLKRPLAMYIKFSEMTEVMNGFENDEVLAACGLDDQNMNYEMMLQAMKMTASKEQSDKLEQMIRMMNLGKMLPSMFAQTASSSQTESQDNSSSQQLDMMRTFANFMQMNQSQQQSNQKSSSMEALLKDPRSSSISPEKLKFIQGFIESNQKKSPDELLPQIMQLSNQMQAQGLSFNKQEMELLLDILKESMTPEERKQVDIVLQMLR